MTGDVLRASALLLVGVALVVMSSWPTWVLLHVLRAVLLVVGVLIVCEALGALVAKASNAHDE